MKKNEATRRLDQSRTAMLNNHNLPAMRLALAARARELSTALLGPPSTASETELRFGAGVVVIAGPHVGRWQTGRHRGDDLLGLISAVHGFNLARAVKFAVTFLARPAGEPRR